MTEMAVRNYMNTKAIKKKHAEFYKKLFQMFVDVNAIPADCSGKSAEEIKKLEESRPLKAVSIWGWQDDPSLEDNNYSYSMNGPYCGLFTETSKTQNMSERNALCWKHFHGNRLKTTSE